MRVRSVDNLARAASTVCLAALLPFGALEAQEHGGFVLKVCGPPVRTCDTDGECQDSDTEACMQDVCDTDLPNRYDCRFSFTNGDEYLDSLLITDAYDEILGKNLTVGLDELQVYAIEGNAVCSGPSADAVGPDNPQIAASVLPCLLEPPGGEPGQLPGRVRFRSNVYDPTMADLRTAPIFGLATVVYFDLCNGIPGPDCSSTGPFLAQALTLQELVSGCIEEPLDCDDGDVCTADRCDPDAGACVHTVLDPLPAECLQEDPCGSGCRLTLAHHSCRVLDSDADAAWVECRVQARNRAAGGSRAPIVVDGLDGSEFEFFARGGQRVPAPAACVPAVPPDAAFVVEDSEWLVFGCELPPVAGVARIRNTIRVDIENGAKTYSSSRNFKP